MVVSIEACRTSSRCMPSGFIPAVKCDRVIPHLFVGAAPLAEDDFHQLKALGITAILSLQTEEDGPEGAIEEERIAASEVGLSFTNLPVTDFNRLDLQWKLPKCVATIERMLAAGDTLYLHCTAGVNRSPTVAVAYLHQCLQWPLEEAVEHVRRSAIAARMKMSFGELMSIFGERQ